MTEKSFKKMLEIYKKEIIESYKDDKENDLEKCVGQATITIHLIQEPEGYINERRLDQIESDEDGLYNWEGEGKEIFIYLIPYSNIACIEAGGY